MIGRILLASAIGLTFAAADAAAFVYKGLCEASAGAFLDDKHFVVASDETNVLQVYERGKPDPIKGVDLTKLLPGQKSDLEAAAVVGDRVYWISSHSLTRGKEDKAARKVFFATRIGTADGRPTIKLDGRVATKLRGAILEAADAKKKHLDIEALAATPNGELLIGLRGPLGGKHKNEALVIPFKNPAAVVERGAPPKFGKAIPIRLEGRGLRSMDLLPGDRERYIIIAGPVPDRPGFAAFLWNGPGSAPGEIKSVDLNGLTPEGAMAVPGEKNLVQILSDDAEVDGKTCDDQNDAPDKRRFRSIDIKLD
jgi:hypothetical protein